MNVNIKCLYIDILKRDTKKQYKMCRCSECNKGICVVVLKRINNRALASYFLPKKD